jgi:biotin carboxylase
MKKMLILGGDAGTTHIVEYAREHGIYTIVTDNRTIERSYTKQMADEYWMLSTTEIEAIGKRCIKENVDAIICGASDFNTDRLIELSEYTKLPCYTDRASWVYSRDKYRFKLVCMKENAPVAKDYHCEDLDNSAELDALNIEYPVVVKPVNLWGSMGVSYCDTREELEKAITNARFLSKNANVIIEKKLNGKEFVAYYALTEDDLALFAFHTINNQPNVEGPCDVIASTATNYTDLFVKDCNEDVKRVFRSCGCKAGIAWAQVLLHEDGHFYIVEMGYRYGGDMTIVPYKSISGFDPIKWAVEVAFGKVHTKEELPEELTGYRKNCACSYRLRVNDDGMIDEFLGEEELKKNGIRLMYFSYPGDLVKKYRVVATAHICADSFEDLCEKMKVVNNAFVIKSGNNNLLLKYEDFERFRQDSFYDDFKR